jgi:2-polyprenyl-3-methyl-5-hydroxy-6-metoxy-1,4-benzoquinol methylase
MCAYDPVVRFTPTGWNSMADPESAYVMGHTDRERRRLALQAALLNPLTSNFLVRAGISAGMRILDLGCGIGEVALIAARLVGPHGHVHCIDVDEAAIEIARSRMRSAGHDHVTFEWTGVNDHSPAHLYDAVVGRHILIHIQDALAVLRKVVSIVHPGGVIAFQEYDLSFYPHGYPELPLMFWVEGVIVEFFRRSVPKANMGTQLFYLMQEAGLPSPECRAECITGGGAHSPVYEWLAETVRSLLPRMEALGITTAAEADIDTLAERLRKESLEKRAVTISPLMVGAFSRKPHEE